MAVRENQISYGGSQRGRFMGTEISGSEFLIRTLEDEDVGFVFGLPGGSILPLYDALRESSKIRQVRVRHEEAASFMADAYARVTGRVGACIATVGPGATNLTIGVAGSYFDSIPTIAMTGNIRTDFMGRNAQQDFDHVKLFEPITRWSAQARAAKDLPRLLRQALTYLHAPRPGPVHLNIPVDVQTGMMEANFLGDLGFPRISGPSASAVDLDEAARMLASSERPIIWAGGGVVSAGASRVLVRLAEAVHVPVATSYNGRGSIPEDHPLSLGRTGQFTPAFVSKVVSRADLVISVGFRFTDVSTSNWTLPPRSSKVIQIDIDPTEFGRNVRPDLCIAGDAKRVLEQLLAYGQRLDTLSKPIRKEWLREIEEIKSAWKRAIEDKMKSDQVPIKPQRIMKELRQLLKRDAVITAEGGFCKEWPSTYFEIYEPRTWIHPAGFTPMGYSLCAAIGAKLALPDRQVVAFTGDGALQMVCQEITTAVENNVSIPVCILNDSSLGMIRYMQKRSYGGRITATEFGSTPDFVKLAESMGAQGKRVEDPEMIAQSMKEALSSNGPFILDFVIDRDEVPGTD
jgi:acetolactate synthase-1/2/3 large subunit